MKSVLGSFCNKWLKLDIEKTDFSLFFYIWLFILWFEAFTIQKRQIKHKIHNSRPKIILETKFQPIFLKTVYSIYFSRTTHFFLFRKRQFAVFEQLFSKIVIFWFQIRILWVNAVIVPNFMNLDQKTAIIREEMSIFKSPCLFLNSCLIVFRKNFWAVLLRKNASKTKDYFVIEFSKLIDYKF